jgi:hypothetical protein
MCLHAAPLASPSLDGGVIVHRCIVPSARPVAGRTRPSYEIDVREFLTTTHNAVIARAIDRDLRAMVDAADRTRGGTRLFGAYRDMWDYLISNAPGSFDLRVEAVRLFVATRVRAVPDARAGVWQFPDETLRLGRGDCEDLSFLVASMLLAAGISAYNVRVCLGTVDMHSARGSRRFDHVWVAYRTEAGHWTVIEPFAPAQGSVMRRAHGTAANPRSTAASVPVRPSAAPHFTYTPHFGFNADHLWSYRSADAASFQDVLKLRTEWRRFSPGFAGLVHRNIVTDALGMLPTPLPVLTGLLGQEFIEFLGDPQKTVAEIDLPWKYHPFDHFDNGYIDESWTRVRERLESCLDAANADMVRAFSRAAHAIADFYAHSSYAHFAARDAAGALVLAKDDDWNDEPLARWPDYGDGGDFPINRFRPASPWQGRDAQRVSVWSGALLSGRWRLPGDLGVAPESSDWSAELRDRRMKWRMALPHHDDIAVDVREGSNGIYDAAAYAAQFDLRYDAAVRHTRRVFERYGTHLSLLG